MALPTASTYGYGYYPTVGPTPDVACNCLREWLSVFRRLLRFKGYGDVDIWQCTGGLSASGGTHSRGGAFDYSGISYNKAMLAREMGAYATWPRNWSGNQHTHGVLSGCPHNEPARYQLVAMRVYRRNGLGYKGLEGPDPLPKPSRYRFWYEGIAWAEAQMGNKTTTTTQEDDDMPLSDADLAKIIRGVRDVSVQVGNDQETLGVATGRTRAGVRRLEAEVAALKARLDALAAETANAVHEKGVQAGNDVEPLGLAIGRTRAAVRRLEGCA